MNLKYVKTYDKNIEIKNIEEETNVSIIVPDNYIVLRFTGTNISMDGKSYEIALCNTIVDQFSDIYWVGEKSLPICMFFKIPDGIQLKEKKSVYTVGAFLVDYILQGESIEIKKDGEYIKRSEILTEETLEKTPYLPVICFPLYGEKRIDLVGLDDIDEISSKLHKHIECVNNTYDDINLKRVINFIDDAFLEYGLDEDYINNLINEEIKLHDNSNLKILDLVKLSDIEVKDPIWVFYPYIALSTIVLISGDPGSGKSYFGLYVASVLSRGGDFINSDNDLNMFKKPVRSLILNGEDSPEFVIKKRIQKLGGDPNYIFVINESSEPFKLNYVKELERIIKKNDIRLIIVDPIQNYLPINSNMDSATQMRACLSPIKDIAEKYNCVFVLIMHKNKNTKTKDLYRVLGSIDFVGLARSALSVEKNDNYSYIYHVKNSIGKLGDRLVMQISDDGISFLDDHYK